MTQDLEASSQLFGAYLHQDWVDEFGSDVEAVQAMMELEPPEVIAEASREIRELLSTRPSEVELASMMTGKIGCYFDPASKGETYRKWLEGVLEKWERTKAISKERYL